MITTFKQFLADDNAWDMYITGVAGTGKTTGLAELISYCHENDIPCITAAFTHKACGVLASKLPKDSKIQTLHKFLKKRPTINTEATSHKHISQNAKFGSAEKTGILFVDEYSMVGEKDLMDIRADQDSDKLYSVVVLCHTL